jgi:hypothetical protein
MNSEKKRLEKKNFPSFFLLLFLFLFKYLKNNTTIMATNTEEIKKGKYYAMTKGLTSRLIKARCR